MNIKGWTSRRHKIKGSYYSMLPLFKSTFFMRNNNGNKNSDYLQSPDYI